MGPDVQSGEYTVYYPKSVLIVQAGCHHPIRHSEMSWAQDPLLGFFLPGFGRGSASAAEGNGNPLQYSYLENPMDGGAW